MSVHSTHWASDATAPAASHLRDREVSPPFDATAGRTEGWLVLVDQGLTWPEALTELLIATTVIIIVAQPEEPSAQLIGRITAGARKFPEHSYVRTGLVIRIPEASELHADVAEAMQTAVGPGRPLLELRGGEPSLLVGARIPEARPSRVGLNWPLRLDRKGRDARQIA